MNYGGYSGGGYKDPLSHGGMGGGFAPPSATSLLSQRGGMLAGGNPLDRAKDMFGKAGQWAGKNPESVVQGLGILAAMYGAKKDRDLYEEDREYERELTEEQRAQANEDRAREQARREALSPYFESLDRLMQGQK